jgi:hypothetical protein
MLGQIAALTVAATVITITPGAVLLRLLEHRLVGAVVGTALLQVLELGVAREG